MQRIFSELAELGKVCPKMQLGEAIKRLGSLATEALFQAKTPPAPIQILGPLEAAGMDFDAIWMLGMQGFQLILQIIPIWWFPMMFSPASFKCSSTR